MFEVKHISIHISGGSRHVFSSDGLNLAHTDLRCIAKYVNEWGSSKRGYKTGRSCSFQGPSAPSPAEGKLALGHWHCLTLRASYIRSPLSQHGLLFNAWSLPPPPPSLSLSLSLSPCRLSPQHLTPATLFLDSSIPLCSFISLSSFLLVH